MQDDASDVGGESKTASLPNDRGLENPMRRRFGLVGVGTSGVLLSLACKPVLGGVVSTSPSGCLSANQSMHGEKAFNGARQPTYWASTGSWPIDGSTKFGQIFSCNRNSELGDTCLKDLVSGITKSEGGTTKTVPVTADTNQLGMYLTTAMLNARKGWTPFLP